MKQYFKSGLTTIAAVGILAFWASCGGGSSVVQSPPQSLFNFSDLSHPALASVIGTWQAACSGVDAGPSGGGATESIEISDTTVTHTIRQFDDSGCTNEDLDIVSTFSVGGADQYSLRAGGSDIDITLKLESTTMTPLGGYAMILDEVSLCGSNAWADGQGLQIQSLSCDGYVTLPAGSSLHDYLEVTGTSLTYQSVTFNKSN